MLLKTCVYSSLVNCLHKKTQKFQVYNWPLRSVKKRAVYWARGKVVILPSDLSLCHLDDQLVSGEGKKREEEGQERNRHLLQVQLKLYLHSTCDNWTREANRNQVSYLSSKLMWLHVDFLLGSPFSISLFSFLSSSSTFPSTVYRESISRLLQSCVEHEVNTLCWFLWSNHTQVLASSDAYFSCQRGNEEKIASFPLSFLSDVYTCISFTFFFFTFTTKTNCFIAPSLLLTLKRRRERHREVKSHQVQTGPLPFYFISNSQSNIHLDKKRNVVVSVILSFFFFFQGKSSFLKIDGVVDPLSEGKFSSKVCQETGLGTRTYLDPFVSLNRKSYFFNWFQVHFGYFIWSKEKNEMLKKEWREKRNEVTNCVFEVLFFCDSKLFFFFFFCFFLVPAPEKLAQSLLLFVKVSIHIHDAPVYIQQSASILTLATFILHLSKGWNCSLEFEWLDCISFFTLVKVVFVYNRIFPKREEEGKRRGKSFPFIIYLTKYSYKFFCSFYSCDE